MRRYGRAALALPAAVRARLERGGDDTDRMDEYPPCRTAAGLDGTVLYCTECGWKHFFQDGALLHLLVLAEVRHQIRAHEPAGIPAPMGAGWD